jgi:diacylglycerol kinase
LSGCRHPPLGGAAVVTPKGLQTSMQGLCQLLQNGVAMKYRAVYALFQIAVAIFFLKTMYAGMH